MSNGEQRTDLLAFHPTGFSWVYYGRLDSERGWLDRVEDRQTGLSMRLIRQWNASDDTWTNRVVTSKV